MHDIFEIVADKNSGCSIVNKSKNYYLIKSIIVSIDEKKYSDELILLDKKNSTLGLDNLFLIAKSQLEIFLYKLSAIFTTTIFLNYPYYFNFNDYLYQKGNNSHCEKLEIDINSLSNLLGYKKMYVPSININTSDMKLLKKVKKKDLNFCYLYYSTLNESHNLCLRLLSAWKYFEAYLELKNIPCREFEKPRKFFNHFSSNCIECKKINGINEKTKKVWLYIEKYGVKFLDEFRKEVRLMIAHHERSNNSRYNIGRKKYIPAENIRTDLRMNRNLGNIT